MFSTYQLFYTRVALVVQSANWQLYRKAWHFWGYTYSERFVIWALFVLFIVTSRIHFAQKNGIKSWKFSCDYFDVDWLNNSALMKLIKFLDMKLHQGPVFIDGMVNSIEPQFTSRRISWRSSKISCCSGNHWYCAPTDIARSSCGLSWDWYNIAWTFWLPNVGSHTICQSLKKINQSEWQKCFYNWFKRMQ